MLWVQRHTQTEGSGPTPEVALHARHLHGIDHHPGQPEWHLSQRPTPSATIQSFVKAMLLNEQAQHGQ